MSPRSPQGAWAWRERPAALAMLGLLLAIATPYLVQHALSSGPTRDEHQFISAAWLLAHEGLWPYLDFNYFHVPYQVPWQALWLGSSDHLLVAARLSSLAWGLGSLGLVFWGGWCWLAGLPWGLRLLWPAALALWLTHNPLFLYSSGRAWNHDLGLFLALASVLFLGQGLQRPRPGGWVLAAGFLLGGAIWTRLSWGPVLLPCLLALYWPGPAQASLPAWRRLLPWLAGLTLASLPALAWLAASGQDMLFGVLVYPGWLTTQFWEQQGGDKAMTWAGKLVYFLRHVLDSPGDLALFGTYQQTRCLFLATALAALPLNLLAVYKKVGPWRQCGLVLLLLPMIFLGAMLPTPNMYQYYYQTVPFSLLALALALAVLYELAPPGPPRWALAASLGLASLYILAVGGIHLGHVGWRDLAAWRAWPAAQTHDLGRQLARGVGPGPVLTLAPVYALEGRLPIYPELASGPFAFRVAHLLPPDQRRERRMLAPQDLPRFLASQPPAAILTGFDPGLEPPLVEYARAHGYQPRPVNASHLALWLPASAGQSPGEHP
ncbi:MAG: hypothetical protein V1806_01915 [Pseudomonadota bacterium]